ncbi:DNA polymerase III subunit delta [Dietzia sp. ANT_WB102]|uniref:DNA polymerase III subunit delta n=1 Tax=Dietzia sp. ANT_WB102 TaxID=2597345 RepID=UPI0011F02C49|nr:DNA polymerase III subunit delta [Dietzia sp. ANT_WB102]KAA0917163.1 DNA polymerase III subunit delta [Dietzia sp. ANT_WB102]
MTSESAPSVLHLVLGEDEFLTERATAGVVSTLRASTPAGQDPPVVSRLGGPEVTAPQLFELLSPSLFGEARIVVITGAAELGKDAQAAILDAAGDLPPETVLIVQHTGGGRAKALVADLRKAGAQEHAAGKLTRHMDVVGFVRSEFRTLNVRVAPEACEALVEAVGTDLRQLSSACGQLVADTGGKVDVEAVRRYHSGVVGVSGFTVAERAVVGDVAGAIEALEWAMHTGVPHVVLADALADAVNSVALVGTQRGVPPADLARQGLPPWKVKKVTAQTRHWSIETLGSALQVVARLNGEVKGQAEDTSYALERAVRAVGSLASSN